MGARCAGAHLQSQHSTLATGRGQGDLASSRPFWAMGHIVSDLEAGEQEPVLKEKERKEREKRRGERLVGHSLTTSQPPLS